MQPGPFQVVLRGYSQLCIRMSLLRILGIILFLARQSPQSLNSVQLICWKFSFYPLFYSPPIDVSFHSVSSRQIWMVELMEYYKRLEGGEWRQTISFTAVGLWVARMLEKGLVISPSPVFSTTSQNPYFPLFLHALAGLGVYHPFPKFYLLFCKF